MAEIKSFILAAKEARSRFKNGYWTNYYKQRDERITEAKEKGINVDDAKRLCQEALKRDISIKFNQNNEEDLLYERVVTLLSSDDVVLNPIKSLIDHAEYDNLSESEKECYILKLTERYNEIKQKYDKEKMLG